MRRSLPLALALAGCAQSPVMPIVGSYFPSWLICAVAGAIGTAIIRQLLVAARLDDQLLLPALTFLATATGIALLLWIAVFGR